MLYVLYASGVRLVEQSSKVVEHFYYFSRTVRCVLVHAKNIGQKLLFATWNEYVIVVHVTVLCLLY